MSSKSSNIHDVARRAGVSIATVSHVFNGTKRVSEETRRRVMTAAEGLKYQPNQQARSLRMNQQTNAVLLIEEACICSTFCASVMSGLLMKLREQYGAVAAEFFKTGAQAAEKLAAQTYGSIFVLCNAVPVQLQGMDGNIFFFLLPLDARAAASCKSPQIHLASAFYEELRLLAEEENYSRIFMSYYQGNDLKRNAGGKSFSNIMVAANEFGAGETLVRDAVARGDTRLLFADYAQFAGCIRYLLRNESLLYSSDLEIAYLAWDRIPETYNFPFVIHHISPENIVKEAMAHLPAKGDELDHEM